MITSIETIRALEAIQSHFKNNKGSDRTLWLKKALKATPQSINEANERFKAINYNDKMVMIYDTKPDKKRSG